MKPKRKAPVRYAPLDTLRDHGIQVVVEQLINAVADLGIYFRPRPRDCPKSFRFLGETFTSASISERETVGGLIGLARQIAGDECTFLESLEDVAEVTGPYENSEESAKEVRKCPCGENHAYSLAQAMRTDKKLASLAEFVEAQHPTRDDLMGWLKAAIKFARLMSINEADFWAAMSHAAFEAPWKCVREAFDVHKAQQAQQAFDTVHVPDHDPRSVN